MPTEPQIRILPDHVANKIAAGEVVERPASVVKELIENALDAGATQIEIEITAGGKKSILVSDNGHGMSRDNALLSLERHATSKIRDADDIEHVSTLGFRGEALAAIAAVSRMTLTTHRAECLSGTEIVVTAGRIQDVKEVGCPPGTTVAVRNLFFNVPARRRFLRSDQTEAAHVRQVFLNYAMSRPATGFRLVEDRREVFRLAAGSSRAERLRDLIGADSFRRLKPLEYVWEGGRFEGFVALPENSRADRSEQHIFINARPATSPVLTYAISEAYRTLLPKGRYPVVYLFIEVNPADVDVNVHPAKKEVRFRKAGELRDSLIQALQMTLQTRVEVAAGAEDASRAPAAVPIAPPLIEIEGLPPPRTFSYPRLPMAPSAGSETKTGAADEKPTERLETQTPDPASRSPWSWCRVLGQVGGLFVVMETEDGLVLMDPHAAHERVLFEKYMDEVWGDKVNSQGLLAAETVEMAPDNAEIVRENLGVLRKMGFGISEFGGDSFLVDAMPVCFRTASPRAVLVEACAELAQAGRQGASERLTEERIAMAACKAAVKAMDRLRIEEIERLVVDLAKTRMPYTCPHGRPTVIFMGYGELRRKFGRP